MINSLNKASTLKSMPSEQFSLIELWSTHGMVFFLPTRQTTVRIKPGSPDWKAYIVTTHPHTYINLLYSKGIYVRVRQVIGK